MTINWTLTKEQAIAVQGAMENTIKTLEEELDRKRAETYRRTIEAQIERYRTLLEELGEKL